MAERSFNLIDEGFIPCVMEDGTRRDLGIRETLEQAHHILEIRDDSPLVTIALHRLLLAILHRNFGPSSYDKWKAIWQASSFDADRLSAYFNKWRGRFDLFDKAHPFYQTAQFATKKQSGSNRLAVQLAQGNNATLFDHTHEADPPDFTENEAARFLITEQAFAIGGGKSETGYATSGPLIGGATVFPVASTLFHTLMLNLVRYTQEQPVPSGKDDVPCWERETPVGGGATPAGYLDYLTWQSRRIRLLAGSDDATTVRFLSYSQGRALSPSYDLHDPHMAFRRDPKKGDLALRLSETRDLWRDAGTLLRWFDTESARPAAVVRWLHDLSLDVTLSQDFVFDCMVVGLCTDKAKVHFWRLERLPFPLRVLADEQLFENVPFTLQLAETAAGNLKGATKTLVSAILAPDGRKPDGKRVGQMVDQLAPDRPYWSRLELPFRELLRELPGDYDQAQLAVARWGWNTVRSTALGAFEETAEQLDHSARVLRAVAVARAQLRRQLNKHLQTQKEILDDASQMAD